MGEWGRDVHGTRIAINSIKKVIERAGISPSIVGYRFYEAENPLVLDNRPA